MRIGHGYDVHAFGPGDHVMLGGVRIAYSKGVKAHSDGDVVLHAVCDALLGAAALGDIGRHFPDTDPKWKGVDSRLLLRETVKLLAVKKLKPAQVDVSVIAEAPKLAPHIAAMCVNLAADLGLLADKVNVKATTHEGLGSIGRGEGLAAHAVTLLTDI
ncbi:MAG TPA: 2-C-methyl-D-erythritol 2,4-cyclodiphosphate synthase [Gammaproteobacteria bacterium]|jgi:2-C-methyl-D-erythritol 2,4-cyclodiphosphate synthase|nr:2-C-methyl-D-erythritol 2,4-cyclodiphosphate synthase [Gammaproteobacteria bacterium]